MRHHLSLTTFFILLLAMLPLSLAGQNRTRIFGTISDQTGAPLPLASVRVVGTAITTVSNLQGHYTLYCTSADTIILSYSMIGYDARRRLLRNPADSVRLDVMLPEYGAQQLGEAEVKGRGVQTGQMGRIDAESAKHMPSTTGNAVEELIATQAGVSTHNELSSQYNVRGGSFSENCVYVNGVEVYRPMLVRSAEQEGLSAINPYMVDRINFSSGGFEARYGDRMSSVLDITYKQPERPEATVQASLLGADAYGAWANRHLSVMSSLRYKTNSLLLGTTDTDAEYRPRFLSWQTAISWRPNRRWSADVIADIADNRYHFTPHNRETSFGTINEAKTFTVYFDGQEKDRFCTAFGAATLTRHFTPQSFLALQFSAFTTNERETYDISGEYYLNQATSQEQIGVGAYLEHGRNRLRSEVYDAALRWRTRLGRHTLLAGADIKWQHVRENARMWEMRDSSGHSLPMQPDRLALAHSERSACTLSNRSIEAYVQDTWRTTGRLGLLNVTYGMRLTHRSAGSETLLSPRVSVGFLPAGAPSWTLRGAVGLYYQAPFYREMRDTTMQQGVAQVHLNEKARSQRSLHIVAGADYTFRAAGRPFRFTAEAYYKALSRLLPYSVEGMRIVYDSSRPTTGYAAGIDFKIFGEFVPGTDSWLTFSLMRTQERLNGRWVPRPTDQRYNVSLFFTDYFPGTDRWKFALKGAVADGLPFGPTHSSTEARQFRAPAYRRVDMGMSYRLYPGRQGDQRPTRGMRSAWLGLDVFNIMDFKNVNNYTWITDVTGVRYAVPNYLTGRLLNVKLTIDF